jgi:hypothetical protein
MYNFKIDDGNRGDLINYIIDKKKTGKFTVVDVGGSHGGWSTPYIDALIDFNVTQEDSKIKFFKCDITNSNDYDKIYEHVKNNGKFDFSICTHTLEDIMNPNFVCEQLCKISNEGYIAIPSKYRELSYIEGNYRGYIHHRWIFNLENEMVVGYPKINYIERNEEFDKIANNSNNLQDFSFYWKNVIKINYINNNYLGPSVDAVKGYYNNLFDL